MSRLHCLKVRNLKKPLILLVAAALVIILFVGALILWSNSNEPNPEKKNNVEAVDVDLFPAVYGDDRYVMKKTKPINSIPHILHFMWNTDRVPQPAVDNILAWRKFYPDWIFMFWSKKDMENAMKRLLSGKLLASFKKLPLHIMRLDFSRYAILYFYGGVYVDIDVKPLRPFETLLQYHSAIIAREQEANSVSLGFHSTILTGNFLMASRPGHPFWPFLMKIISQRKSRNILRRAGPVALNVALGMYKQDMHLAPRTSAVFLAPSQYFNPPNNDRGSAVHIEMLTFRCPMLMAKKHLPWFPHFICESFSRNKRIDYSFGFNYPRYFTESFTKHLLFHTYGKEFKKNRTFVPLDSLSINLWSYDSLLRSLPPLTDVYSLEEHFTFQHHKT